MRQNNYYAILFHCAPSNTNISKAFKGKAIALASLFVKTYSLSELFEMNYDIVYRHICELILQQLITNPNFTPETFCNHISLEKLFYSFSDMVALATAYRESPDEILPYAFCYFGRLFKKAKRKMSPYLKDIEEQEQDEVMVIAINNLLMSYTPGKPFSPNYVYWALTAALAELAGDYYPVRLNRNELIEYEKFKYFTEKYKIARETIRVFLDEILLSGEEAATRDDLLFEIDEQDRDYSCKLTLTKALAFFEYFSVSCGGFIPCEYYDADNDKFYDLTEGKIDSRFSDAELRILENQITSSDSERYLFRHFQEPGGVSISNSTLRDINSSRYDMRLFKQDLKDTFTVSSSPKPKRKDKKRKKNDPYKPIE